MIFAAALLALAVQDAPAPGAPTRTALVHFADGNTLPLRNWTLSYEFVTWEKGRSPASGIPARRDAADLWIGRRAFPLVPGAVLSIEYAELRRETLVDGRPQSVVSSAAREIRFAAPAGTVETRVEPPDRLFLATGAPKTVNLLARSMDLRGEGITGTRREVCVLSFSSLVDCGASPAQQVVKVEFH